MPLIQAYQGRLHYGPALDPRIPSFAAVIPCQVEGVELLVRALFDTGSEFCVLGADLVSPSVGAVPDVALCRLHSRFGTIDGTLQRLRVRFVAEEGESFETEATWFVSPDWPGLTVIGWRGCLERFRFAVDPGDDSFYFGELE